MAGAEVYNDFRDYDPSIGRYVESDPIGVKGVLAASGLLFDQRRYTAFAALHPDEAKVYQDAYLGPYDSATPAQLDTYSYVQSDPLNRSDRNGEFGALGWAAIGIGAAVAAGWLIWENHCLTKLCDMKRCPYADNDDNIPKRIQWQQSCWSKCWKAPIEMFHAYGMGDLGPTKAP